ncbi:hypothetical protein BJ508DRAFT_410437 [Ascobolus immersus RN42]|uniref:Chaperone/heat shock protein Hsp12 n=1 Tax=Ascobolus immersus RN42 TaxID=1160509 RepID=A0A3N4ISJ0_ASCIM|nr:hypothetical protein BJ508DRAFT_410437 [Ascobolus immersus RN42]
MSDFGRKDLSSQVHDAVKPDSQKTTTEHIGDNLTGAADRVAAAVQPNSEKSNTQAAGDAFRGGKDDAENKSAGVVDTVKDYANAAVNAASETINNLTGNNNNKPAGSA